MGPTWVLSAPDGPHVGPMNLVIWIDCEGRLWDVYCDHLWSNLPCNEGTVMSLTARFMGPTWGPSGADRTQVGPMLAPWTFYRHHSTGDAATGNFQEPISPTLDNWNNYDNSSCSKIDSNNPIKSWLAQLTAAELLLWHLWNWNFDIITVKSLI